MRRVILCKKECENFAKDPDVLWEYLTNRRIAYTLSKMLADNLGFEYWPILPSKYQLDELNKDVEIFFLQFKTVFEFPIDDLMKLLSCYPKAKIIFMPIDEDRPWKWRHYAPLVKRVDAILDFQKHSCFMYEEEESEESVRVEKKWFESIYPGYAHKQIFFPHCLTPAQRWTNLEFKEKPIMKCLFSGRVGGRYHLRSTIIERIFEERKLQDIIDILMHPKLLRMVMNKEKHHYKTFRYGGYHRFEPEGDFRFDKDTLSKYYPLKFINNKPVVGDEYADLLSNYFCGICGGTEYNYHMLKLLEIPAAGSLLLAQRFSDLDELGFIPDVHYVPVTKESAIKKIKEVLADPDKYWEIRKAGRKFVRKHHTIETRFKQLKEIIENVGGVI